MRHELTSARPPAPSSRRRPSAASFQEEAEVSDQLAVPARSRAILAAAAARIIPSDDGPGAREADAAEYVVGALSDPFHRHFAELFGRGLELLQYTARQQFESDFVDCTAEQQDTVLCTVQEYPNNEARRFFVELVQLVLEGFLGDPRHGGNRGRAGWRCIGYRPLDAAGCREPEGR